MKKAKRVKKPADGHGDVEVSIRLPLEVIKKVELIAALCNQPASTVVNVMLAITIMHTKEIK